MSKLREFSDPGLTSIQFMLDTAVQEDRIPSGIGMIARDDEIIWLGTAGFMGPDIPMKTDAIIPLASAGKIYTAAAVMILTERGKIALDDPVHLYIPEFADVLVEPKPGLTELEVPDTPITISHLLTHTGGLSISGNSFWAAWNMHSERTTTTDLARDLAKLPLTAQPGERFEYGPTGASYEVLGAVVEITTNQTLETFMFENIFEPLGLGNTFFYLPAEKKHYMPAFYRRIDGDLNIERPYGVDFPRTTFFHGGGGVESSPQDIWRFMRLFLNGGMVDGVRILQQDSINMMMTDHIKEKSPFPGGLGWGFGGAVLATDQGVPLQYGWAGGGYATIWVDLNDRFVGYFAFPVMPPGDNALLNELRYAAYSALQ